VGILEGCAGLWKLLRSLKKSQLKFVRGMQARNVDFWKASFGFRENFVKVSLKLSRRFSFSEGTHFGLKFAFIFFSEVNPFSGNRLFSPGAMSFLLNRTQSLVSSLCFSLVLF
jgi:hypothetical protein